MSVAASLIATTMNASTPLLLAALGILVAERSGVLNLGVEGIMLMAAIAGYMATVETGSFAVGFIAAVAVGILFVLFFAIFAVGLRANQQASGSDDPGKEQLPLERRRCAFYLTHDLHPFKNDLLAQVEVGNGQRYCLTAPAVFHYAGDIIAGGFVVAVHGLHQELLIGKIGNILLYTLDDLSGGQQSLLGQPHNTGLIVGTPVFLE